MRSFYQEEFESGDKVKLITDYYERHGYNFKKGDIFIVKYQDDDDVMTDKGWFEFQDFELVKD
jgi:hypothetical protein